MQAETHNRHRHGWSAGHGTAVPAGVTPIASLAEGRAGIVRHIGPGCCRAHRLAEMGILPGTVVRVRRGRGPMIVDVKDQRLILGHGLVKHILVEPVA